MRRVGRSEPGVILKACRMILLRERRRTGRERDGEYKRSGRDASTIAGRDKWSRRTRRAQVTRRAGSDKNGGKNYCERAYTGSSGRKSGARRRVDTARRGIMVLPIYLASSHACQQPTSHCAPQIIQASSLHGGVIRDHGRLRLRRELEFRV